MIRMEIKYFGALPSTHVNWKISYDVVIINVGCGHDCEEVTSQPDGMLCGVA